MMPATDLNGSTQYNLGVEIYIIIVFRKRINVLFLSNTLAQQFLSLIINVTQIEICDHNALLISVYIRVIFKFLNINEMFTTIYIFAKYITTSYFKTIPTL